MKFSRETIEQRRSERRAVKKENRKKRIVRHCCKECGQPKHYVCLEHFQQKKTLHHKIQKKIRYYFKKYFWVLVHKLGFINKI